MFDYIRVHQMNIMLALCSVCAMMALLLLITRFLPKKRKWILIFMELVATFLLAFDRAAYIYRGDVSRLGYIMVRLSNFMVFYLTSAVVFGFNLYLTDYLLNEGGLKEKPQRLKISLVCSVIGMAMAVIAHFTGLYYYFNDQNVYQRGSGFLISYIVPVVIPLVQFSVIMQYKNHFSKLILTSMVLYIFVPIVMGILQIFTYGISIVNMAMVLVSVSLYVFAYIDINNTVMRSHLVEVENMQNQSRSMKRLFDQTATAFVTAVEKRDELSVGHSVRVGHFAKRIAEAAGKDEEFCSDVYYAALLHDVGMVGIPDSLLNKRENLSEEEIEEIKKKPAISEEILSNIREYPYLSSGARSAYERYDGSGYPDGLKGREIPEISRIIAVADAYDEMTSENRINGPVSYPRVREEFVKEAGLKYDPEFSEIMVHLMDEDQRKDVGNEKSIETELVCEEYRQVVSNGIPVDANEVSITFHCESQKTNEDDFSAPAIILFDSYDRNVHTEVSAIDAYRYLEYGEIWFDGHYISTNVRNMVVEKSETDADYPEGDYEIVAKRFEDHVSVEMKSKNGCVEAVIALVYVSKASYIGITGENCVITDIAVEKTGAVVKPDDINRIVDKVSYINRLESDVKNIQIDRLCSAYTTGIEVTDEVTIDFHSMTLPSANLVWHCPYIVLFTSKDGNVHSESYIEYVLIKLNGEYEDGGKYAQNQFAMKKNDMFTGWADWRTNNIEGMEFSVNLLKRGNKVILKAENMGIEIENTTTIWDENARVYVALTGDQVALTDIRVR